jgi:DNA-binding LacI/PurR family transcriptional regulator
VKKKAKVTSHEVAALAGVSRSAVSRTYTSGASVSAHTRERVIAAAAKLGYRPNALARSLIVRSTQLIGLVMSEWENPFYTRMLRLFSERLQAEGYQLLLLTSDSESDADDAIRRLLQYQVDGVIVVSARPSAMAAVECVRAGTPLVLVNREIAASHASSVTCDNRQIGRDIVAPALKSGYKRLALVRGDRTAITSVERTKAIRRAVAAGKVASIVAEIDDCFGYDAGRRLMTELWKSDPRPDVVICSSDLTALGVLDGARSDLGIDVPGKLGVIGLGDIPQASWSAYQLTTVHLPIEEMIDLAVKDLLARLADPGRPPRSMVAKARVIRRQSTR